MCRFGLGLPGGVIDENLTRFFVAFEHVVGVAVVGGNNQDAIGLSNGLQHASQAKIDGLHGNFNRRKDARVTHHIAVGIDSGG